MGRFVVLPRGINVGTRNRVPMATLRPALEASGGSEVTTIGQSGNIVLTLPTEDPVEAAAHVARVVEECSGAVVPCLARTAEQLRRVAALDPLGEVATDGSRLLVTFLSAPPSDTAAAALLAEDHSPQAVHLEGAEVWVWTPEGVKAMTLSYAALEKRFGCVATARNANTVQKIAAAL